MSSRPPVRLRSAASSAALLPLLWPVALAALATGPAAGYGVMAGHGLAARHGMAAEHEAAGQERISPVVEGSTVPRLVLAAPQAAADSAAMRSRARDAQAAFERARIRFAPRTHQTFGGGCDERVGRMCVRISQGTENEWVPPPEDPRVTEARDHLLTELAVVGEAIPGDTWVLAQRVAYLGESGAWDDALEIARGCAVEGDLGWWCLALEGLAAHHGGDFEAAEQAFDDALDRMPSDVRDEWKDLTPVVERGLQGLFRDARGDSLSRLEARLWTMADPLFLVPGNDRRTEHFSRHVLARIRAEARNPYAMGWGGDLAEILVRYGPEVAYEQQLAPQLHLGPTPVVGRFDPQSRGFLPPEDHFLDPAGIAPGEWRSDQKGMRARHAPSYAPRIGRLEVQQARFRRGEDLLLVLGWTVAGASPEWEPSDVGLQAGLFLLQEGSLPFAEAVRLDLNDAGEGALPAGTVSTRVPAGRYLASLEVLDREGRRAWRARHGVVQESISRGVVALSDLLLLAPEAAAADGSGIPRVSPGAPGSEHSSFDAVRGVDQRERLEDHLERTLPGVGLSDGVVEIAWEVYGLTEAEGVLGFRLTAVPDERGFLRRAGEFFRLLEPERGVEISWEEGLPPNSPASPLFRRVVMDLSALPLGPVRLTLSMVLPGRTEARSELLIERLDPGSSGP